MGSTPAVKLDVGGYQELCYVQFIHAYVGMIMPRSPRHEPAAKTAQRTGIDRASRVDQPLPRAWFACGGMSLRLLTTRPGPEGTYIDDSASHLLRYERRRWHWR
jgi:hypothetical protein